MEFSNLKSIRIEVLVKAAFGAASTGLPLKSDQVRALLVRQLRLLVFQIDGGKKLCAVSKISNSMPVIRFCHTNIQSPLL